MMVIENQTAKKHVNTAAQIHPALPTSPYILQNTLQVMDHYLFEYQLTHTIILALLQQPSFQVIVDLTEYDFCIQAAADMTVKSNLK